MQEIIDRFPFRAHSSHERAAMIVLAQGGLALAREICEDLDAPILVIGLESPSDFQVVAVSLDLDPLLEDVKRVRAAFDELKKEYRHCRQFKVETAV